MNKPKQLRDTFIKRFTLTNRRVKALRVDYTTHTEIDDWIDSYHIGGWCDGKQAKTIGSDIIIDGKHAKKGDWIVIDDGSIQIKTNAKFTEEYYRLHFLPEKYLKTKRSQYKTNQVHR